MGKDDYWKETMFLLFKGGGEMYLIDCNDKSPTYQMIYKHWVGAVDYEVVITMYDSLNTLLTTILECFESKVYYFNETGGLQSDYKKEVVISRRNNPMSALLKLYDYIE